MAAWEKRKKQELEAALDEAERTLRKVRLIVLRDGGQPLRGEEP